MENIVIGLGVMENAENPHNSFKTNNLKNKSPKSNWIVKVECVVRKDIFCEGCTEKEAQEHPYSFSSDERETDTIDYQVIRVEENV